MSSSIPKIDLLPEHLIDQIKAGEVIERPGNLIKEILENAVDAGATRIELSIRNNGLDLISLKDNGHGMRSEDLPLAFSRHATSKISRFEDLYKLRSFGFRGEALASIAAISRVQCISKTSDDTSASEIRIEGGFTVFQGQRMTALPASGTELVIQDLFFNTPVRLKFIQSQQAEKNFIKKIVFAFILSSPKVEFQIKVDDEEKDIFPARESLNERIGDLFFKVRNKILFSQRFYENNELDLFLIPAQFKAPVKLQYIFINDRYILDKQLHRVLSSAIDAASGGEDFHYVAQIYLPPDAIDVNVHPNKTIIKVMENSKLLSLLSSTAKELIGKKHSSEKPQTPGTQLPTYLDYGSEESPILQQERHQYNMEGFFSPHSLPLASTADLIWIGSAFLKREEEKWFAVSAPKLLKAFTSLRLRSESPTVPLLVSEPFPAIDVKPEVIKDLCRAGVELEYLGSDTLVLRGIPDWMNGFPLQEIMKCLIYGRDLSGILIGPADWSQTTWEMMLETFSPDELIRQKILLDLTELLREKFR